MKNWEKMTQSKSIFPDDIILIDETELFLKLYTYILNI